MTMTMISVPAEDDNGAQTEIDVHYAQMTSDRAVHGVELMIDGGDWVLTPTNARQLAKALLIAAGYADAHNVPD